MVHQIGENPQVGIRSNWLTVNSGLLRADVLPDSSNEKTTVSTDELKTVLLMGRLTILQSIEDFYEQTVAKNPGLTIVRPSIFTVQLGTQAQTEGRDSQVFTERGYANGGVNTSKDEIKEEFHPYWEAVKSAGFLSEVRRTSGKANGGSWLLLRKPTLEQVAYQWFGHREGSALQIIDSSLQKRVKEKDELDHADIAFCMRCVRLYRFVGGLAIDRYSDANGDEQRSRQQIGLELAIGALNQCIGNDEAMEINVEDALTYARNDNKIDEAAVRAIENSVY